MPDVIPAPPAPPVRAAARLLGPVLIAAGAWVAPAAAEEARMRDGLPFVPPDSVQVEDSVKTCGIDAYTRFWEHRYQTKPPPAGGPEFDLMLVGLFDPDVFTKHGPPLVWLYFGARREVVDVFVTVPGRPVEHLSNAGLVKRWPHVCDMIEDLHRAAPSPR